MKMKKTVAMLVVLAAASASFADPVVYNASFESPDTADSVWLPLLSDQPGGQGWEFYAGAGGFQSGICQEQMTFTYLLDAAEGDQVGSLWCPNDTIVQNVFGFEIGTTYDVSWSEVSRNGFPGSLEVQMDGGILMAAHAVPDSSASPWIVQTVQFTATDTVHRLGFLQAGAWDQMVHIDAVSIVAIPEPATLGLFALLGGAMFWIRKRSTI